MRPGNMQIDYFKIAAAVDHYSDLYLPLEVPYIVPDKYHSHTLPEDKQRFSDYNKLPDGHLVGSGEQSFAYLWDTRYYEMVGRRYLCVTPCFRTEDRYDLMYKRGFLKVELFDSRCGTPEIERINLDAMIQKAVEFFQRYLAVDVVQTSEGFDICSRKLRIELGSYGIRKMDKLKWIYGTGVAEPRLSNVLIEERVHV